MQFLAVDAAQLLLVSLTIISTRSSGHMCLEALNFWLPLEAFLVYLAEFLSFHFLKFSTFLDVETSRKIKNLKKLNLQMSKERLKKIQSFISLWKNIGISRQFTVWTTHQKEKFLGKSFENSKAFKSSSCFSEFLF